MRIGIAQINTIVGDLRGNQEKILSAYRTLCDGGAQMVLFPELAICGYPPRDLLFKRRFVGDVEECLIEIAARTGDVPALVGFVETNPGSVGRPFFNSAAWCRNGEVQETARKCLLPTYDVFDEDRYFARARRPTMVAWDGRKIGITICEDIWSEAPTNERPRYEDVPLQCFQHEPIDLLINLSASPWYSGKTELRRKLISGVARFCRAPAVLCNSVGGNDELIFDGESLVASPEGELIAALSSFREELRVVDLEEPGDQSVAAVPAAIEEIEKALVLGLRDYARKSGFRQALIGLSGGIDSSVTACLAVSALGRENVLGISNPSAISSQHSRDDAAALAENLGIQLHVLPINPIVDAAHSVLHSLFEGTEQGVAEENIQARTRGLLWMAISNKFGHLLLTCGNKSELAVGYCTLYGDMCGGLAVISDLPKTKVFELARHLNRNGELIPRSVLEKPPSAELRPNQKDEDSLPPYSILDDILERYIERGESSRDIIQAGFDEAIVRDVVRKVDLNEYKRKQAAPGLKISPLAFGVGRRLPIVQRYVS